MPHIRRRSDGIRSELAGATPRCRWPPSKKVSRERKKESFFIYLFVLEREKVGNSMKQGTVYREAVVDAWRYVIGLEGNAWRFTVCMHGRRVFVRGHVQLGGLDGRMWGGDI